MNKHWIAGAMLLSLSSAFAIDGSNNRSSDNLSMMINGVRPVDVIAGSEHHSFTIDRPELFPTICPEERLVIDATLPLAETALGIILGIENSGERFAELEYKMKEDGECHVWKFSKEDSWRVDNLFLQPHLWSVTGTDSLTGRGRLVSLGCPTHWTIENQLWFEHKTNLFINEGRMIGRWGDWCDSGEYKFQIPTDGYSEWRIINRKPDGTEIATDWVTLEPTP